MNLVLITHKGLVTIVPVAPAVIAAVICTAHVSLLGPSVAGGAGQRSVLDDRVPDHPLRRSCFPAPSRCLTSSYTEK